MNAIKELEKLFDIISAKEKNAEMDFEYKMDQFKKMKYDNSEIRQTEREINQVLGQQEVYIDLKYIIRNRILALTRENYEKEYN